MSQQSVTVASSRCAARTWRYEQLAWLGAFSLIAAAAVFSTNAPSMMPSPRSLSSYESPRAPHHHRHVPWRHRQASLGDDFDRDAAGRVMQGGEGHPQLARRGESAFFAVAQPTTTLTNTSTNTATVKNTTTTPAPTTTFILGPSPQIFFAMNVSFGFEPLAFRTAISQVVSTNLSRIIIDHIDVGVLWGRNWTNVTFYFTQRTLAERAANASNAVSLTVALQIELVADTSILFDNYLKAYNIIEFRIGELFTEPVLPTATVRRTTPLPTINVSDAGALPPDDSNNDVMLGIIFGVLGGLLVIGVGVFLVKKFALRDTGKHKKQLKGYRYAQ